jgi:microcystin-dependent protein
MSEPFLGQITAFPYGFAPHGWADCNGQLLPIPQYAALFSLLGTTYGGNGTTNFALPDLQGRIPVGQGQNPAASNYAMGEKGGAESVVLTTDTVPPHTHILSANSAFGTSNVAPDMILATAQKNKSKGVTDRGNIYNPAAPSTALAPTSITPIGKSLPHNNVQPSLVLRYCIALNGIFPTRA